MVLFRFQPAVKALMISRYVRKDWRRLYFSYPYSNIQFMGGKVSAGSKFRFGYFVDEVSTGKLGLKTLDFSCQLPYDPTKEWHAVNSCNGLVCLLNQPAWMNGGTHDNSAVCVCNPILGEWISIPISDANCVCALGFSAKNNQYKILRCTLEDEWKIYTLGTGRWRSIKRKKSIRPWSYYCLGFSTFIHGSLHWIGQDGPPFAVQSFNFETERFKVFSLPERESAYMTEEEYRGVELGVINDCLWASFYNGFQTDDCEMWAMKEYGDEKSWTMTLALRDNYHHKYDPPDEELLARHKELVIYKDDDICYHKLLFTLNGEEMLVCDDGRFICYNIKMMRRRFAPPTRLSYYCNGAVTAYNPSFVSLHDVVKGEQVIRGEFPRKRDKFGGYKCADCGGSPSYKSSTRFNSGCVWPAFFEGLPGAINRTKDPDGWRTEITCRACGAPCVQRGGYKRFDQVSTC